MKILFIIFALIIYKFNYSQKLSQIDSILRVKFPAKNGEGWHYYHRWGKLAKLTKPQLVKLIPHLRFYRASLTYTLDYHIDESLCFLVYNTHNKSLELIDPIWFSGKSIDFLRTFEGKSFRDSISLKKFVAEIQSLINISYDYPVRNTKYDVGKITFDVINTNIGGRIWRKYEIEMADMTIKGVKYK